MTVAFAVVKRKCLGCGRKLTVTEGVERCPGCLAPLGPIEIGLVQEFVKPEPQQQVLQLDGQVTMEELARETR